MSALDWSQCPAVESSCFARLAIRIGRPKAKADCLRPSRLAVLANLLRLLLLFGCDRNLNVSTLFELHIIAMFVG
jgi:hypothetical protein